MKLKFLTYLSLAFLGIYWTCAMSSCAKNNEVDLQKSNKDSTSSPGCDTTGMTYSVNIKPILSTNCYGCHGAASYQTRSGINLEDFGALTTQVKNGNLLNSIKHTGGVTPMPLNGAQLSACDINKITDWINNGIQNN